MCSYSLQTADSKVQKKRIIRCPKRWTLDDDNQLIKAVKIYGTGHWNIIAEHVKGFTNKQCRERWLSHLSPDIIKDSWTMNEDQFILSQVETIGTKWAQISHMLPGRTPNSIKNRYFMLLRKMERNVMKPNVLPTSNNNKENFSICNNSCGPDNMLMCDFYSSNDSIISFEETFDFICNNMLNDLSVITKKN